MSSILTPLTGKHVSNHSPDSSLHPSNPPTNESPLHKSHSVQCFFLISLNRPSILPHASCTRASHPMVKRNTHCVDLLERAATVPSSANPLRHQRKNIIQTFTSLNAIGTIPLPCFFFLDTSSLRLLSFFVSSVDIFAIDRRSSHLDLHL